MAACEFPGCDKPSRWQQDDGFRMVRRCDKHLHMSKPGRALSDTVQFKVRFKEHIRAKLKASADAEGRTLNAEIVARLERSLWGDRLGVLERRIDILQDWAVEYVDRHGA